MSSPRFLTFLLALLPVALVVALPSSASDSAPAQVAAAAPAKPNILVILTDDQDARTLEPIAGLPHVDSRCHAPAGIVMPCVYEHIQSRGVTFAEHTAAYPLCCPSRATYITGQYPHNHHVRANGDYDKLDKKHVLPVWMQRAGYATAYAGKYQGPSFLGWGHADHTDGVPDGWDRFYGLIDAGAGVSAYNYFHYVIDANGVPEPHGDLESDYQTDVLTDKAVGFVEEQELHDGQPFYLSVGYVGPHWSNPPSALQDPDIPALAEGDPAFEANQAPPVPAPRHMDELAAFKAAGLRAQRTAAFNEADVSDKPAFVRDHAPLGDDVVARIDHWYQRRLATLLGVDENIGRIIDTLDRLGELDNTYIVFTADNGWLEGAHRLAFQKQHAYEESSHLPMVIAGPGVGRPRTVAEPTSNTDWAATVAGLAGAAPDHELDGVDLSGYLHRPGLRLDRAVFQESTTGADGYVGVRTRRYRYVEYATGEKELYDEREDPAELRSLHADPRYAEVRARLAELVKGFRACHGQSGAAACARTGVDLPAPRRLPGW
jgi:arylsulfatase A-like enzyme